MYVFFGTVRLVSLIIVYFLAYALSSVGLYTIAKNNGVRCPYLAFVPIAQYYIIGTVCEEYELFGVTVKPLGFVMPMLAMIQILLGTLGSFLTFIPVLVISVVFALIMHKFFYLFDSRKALVLAVLSIFGQLITAVALYYIKDMRMNMSAAAYQYPFGKK